MLGAIKGEGQELTVKGMKSGAAPPMVAFGFDLDFDFYKPLNLFRWELP